MKQKSVKWSSKRKIFLMGLLLFILIPGIAFIIVQKNFISLLVFSLLLLSYFGLLSFLFKSISRIPRIIDELSHQKGYFRKILNNLGEGLITTDQEGRIDFMNPFAEKLTGWSWQEAKRQPLHKVYNIINESTGEAVEHIVHRILKEGINIEWENNTLLKTKTGNALIISNSCSALRDANGNISGAVLLFNDITENIEREKLIKKSEEKYRGIIDQASEGIIIYSLDGTIYEFNQSAFLQTGYSREEFSRLKLTHLLSDGKIVTNHTEVEKMMAGKSIIINRKIKCRDGRIVETEISSRMLSDGKLIAIVRDMTERLKTERALAESENHLRTIIEAEPECVKLFDKKGLLLEMNRAGLEMIEADSLEQVKGKPVLGIVDEPYQQAFINLTKNVFKGISGVLEFEITGMKGTRRWLETHAVPLRNIDKEIIAVLSVTRDITERKKADQKIQETLWRYDMLSHATSDTIWEWDVVNNKMIYNYGITAMFGFDIREVEKGPEWWKKNVHSNDIIQVNEQLQDAFAKNKQTIQMEYRYRCADGSYKNILDRAYIIYHGSGLPLRMIGAMQDITYQKEEESRLGKVMIDAQERERHQIGMELHDNVKQILTASLLYLGMASDNISDHKKVNELLKVCKDLINDSVTELRRLSHQLAPASFDNISLSQVVCTLLQNMNPDNKWTAHVDFREISDISIHPDIKINIYRILQEQLNNIVKYADATEVDISARLSEDQIVLRITDNGVGFDLSKVKMGIGLENIKRRTLLFSGDLVIDSGPGQGCSLFIKLPLKNNNKVLNK